MSGHVNLINIHQFVRSYMARQHPVYNGPERRKANREAPTTQHTEIAAHGPVERDPEHFELPSQLDEKHQALHDFLTRPL